MSRVILTAMVVGVLSACSGGDTTTIDYMPNMMDSDSVKAQESIMRTPVEGTVPRGFTPYALSQSEGAQASGLVNPLPRTTKHFMRGESEFMNYCSVCHGPMGKGNGSIVPKFPRPPTLHSKKVREWSDGRLYHVISRGQNLMPQYASKIRPEDRWAVVHYIRALQRATNPTEKDFKEYKRYKLLERVGRK